MYYVYVLESISHKILYTGMTNNLKRRFKEHNSGDCYFTKRYKPFILIYYEASIHQNDARAREIFLKSGMGKKYLKNRMKNFHGMDPVRKS
jgi:putative endonuclease